MVKYSAFCLSLMSPFFHKTLCGPFKEATERQMVLQEDERAVRKVMELACGCKGGVCVRDAEEMVVLGAVADQYGMEAVVSAVEDAIVRSVTVETCGEVLCRSGGGQLPRAECAARKVVLLRFEAVSWSGGFKAMSEEMLCDLVVDPGRRGAGRGC